MANGHYKYQNQDFYDKWGYIYNPNSSQFRAQAGTEMINSFTNLLKSYERRHEIRFVEMSRKSKFSLRAKTINSIDDVL